MEKVLVSACLLGEPVRYNARDKRCDHDILQRWLGEGRVVPVCPEVAGGLPIPRPPAEIASGADAAAVLDGTAAVLDDEGRDVSAHFLSGAEVALAAARLHRIRVAVLKEGSPSCGSSFVYDGSFTGARVAGPGVTAALLERFGIRVFNEDQLEEAERFLRGIEWSRNGNTPPPAPVSGQSNDFR
jgi:uncharacterized protein YbbK (DUF523 family)